MWISSFPSITHWRGSFPHNVHFGHLCQKSGSNIWVYIWFCYLIPVIYMSAFVPVPWQFCLYGSAVQPETRSDNTSSIIGFSRDCLGYPGSSVLLHKFYYFLFLWKMEEFKEEAQWILRLFLVSRYQFMNMMVFLSSSVFNFFSVLKFSRKKFFTSFITFILRYFVFWGNCLQTFFKGFTNLYINSIVYSLCNFTNTCTFLHLYK